MSARASLPSDPSETSRRPFDPKNPARFGRAATNGEPSRPLRNSAAIKSSPRLAAPEDRCAGQLSTVLQQFIHNQRAFRNKFNYSLYINVTIQYKMEELKVKMVSRIELRAQFVSLIFMTISLISFHHSWIKGGYGNSCSRLIMEKV